MYKGVGEGIGGFGIRTQGKGYKKIERKKATTGEMINFPKCSKNPK